MAHRSDLETFVDWVDNFEEATDSARRLSERDRDFYDGKQWTNEELAQLRARGQPPTVVNLIQKKVNFLKGAEIRTRVDPDAMPRTPQHEDDRDIAVDALRYVADTENFDTIRSLVYENLLIEGYGGCIVDVEVQSKTLSVVKDAKKTKKGPVYAEAKEIEISPEIRLRHVYWDRLIYDPASRKPDFSDAKFRGVVVWMDLEDAIATYGKNPHRTDDFDKTLEATVEGAHTGKTETFDDRPHRWADQKRKRVKIVEMYYKHAGDWYVCHFTQGGFVVWPKTTGLLDEDGHHICPLIMCSAFINRENDRYGVVRAWVSSQEEYNKRRSKALHLLSTRSVVAEEGVVASVDTAKHQLARPDGWTEVRAGALTDGSFQVNQSTDLAQAQFQLLQQSQAEIDSLGPNLQLEAADRSVISARAIVARQQAATMELETVHDSLRGFGLAIYRHIWWLVRQFWTEEDWIRVRDDNTRKGFRFVAINRRISRAERIAELVTEYNVPVETVFDLVGWPEGGAIAQQIAQIVQAQAQQAGAELAPEQIQELVFAQLQQMPEAQEQVVLNDVAKIDVDIILDVKPDVTVLQQEQFDTLARLRESGVEIPLPILLEASDLRNKRELLDRLQEMSQPDPQQAQMQQQQLEAQMQLMQSQVATLQAQAAKLAADAQRSQAQTAQTMAEVQTHQAVTQAEIEKDQAQAAKDMSEAGAIVGGSKSSIDGIKIS